MRRSVTWVWVLLLLAPGTGLADVEPPAGKPVVAVLPFTSPTPYSMMGRNAQEAFVTQLVNTRKLRVVQASMVTRMLRRHGLHWTGTVDPRLLKAAGQWLKADYVMADRKSVV